MTTGKVLLIGGGVLAGGYILYQLFKQPTTTPRTATQGNLTAAGTLVSGLVSLFGGANAATPSGATGVGSGTSFFGSSAAAAANSNNPYLVSTPAGGYTAGAATNYAYADSHPGTALPDGVYGPPIPATGLAAPTPATVDSSSTDVVYA